MKYELYEVGGHVRDQILGIPSKDIDYSVVVEESYRDSDPLSVFYLFVEELKEEGYDVFLETPDCFTIRAKFPNSKEVADFVLARRETEYIDGTRRPRVVLGSLEDDLLRRDFTVNAMARNKETKEFIDLFGGQQDLQDKILRTPKDAAISFKDDPLRILRALRFAITKEFKLSEEVIDAIKTFSPEGIKKVSLERIRDELEKMFYHDSFETFVLLTQLNNWNPFLFYGLFRGKNMWLMPTMKKK